METKTMVWIAVLVLITGAGAQYITIEKTAPEEVGADEILLVNISVESNLENPIEIVLKEVIDFAEPVDTENLVQYQKVIQKEDEVIINGIRWLNSDGKCGPGCKEDGICDPDCGCTVAQDMDCAIFIAPISPHYEWKFTVGAYSAWKVSYRVKPFGIGTMRIKPSTATTARGEFYSNPLTVEVRCNGNGLCEKGENSMNCPEDCPPGSEDGICNGAVDGVCDPDCGDDRDPDCIEPVCGDGRCGRDENYTNCKEDCPRPVICGDRICDDDENYIGCPDDCPSGGEDGYCDGVDDGKCDSDCGRVLDPDCICVKDGMCELEFRENYANCPDDCPSGGEDGYCDGVDDGKCDSDCNPPELDEDCLEWDYRPYVLLLVLVIAALLLYKKFRRRQ